ncbi:hypothetical protein OAP75_02915, partial [Candidatus Pseudothioglobus singularis]|nr:hypothetical protein [Candidatus Pseudothioglobus singularis]
MRRSLLFFFFLLFFGSVQAQSCITFAEDLGFNTWTNKGICLGVSREIDHKCYSYEANKRKLDCSIPSVDGWACKKGFIKEGQLCKSGTFVPKNAYKNSSGWSCNYNFIKNSSGKGCKSLPLNSVKTSENSFKCNFGYKKNSSGSKCIVIPKKQPKTRPDNSYFTNLNVQGWKCRAGFVQVNNNCIQEKYNIPKNAISYNGAWVCGSDYILNKSEDGCQKVPLNGYSSKYSNSWGCKTNYQKSGDKCVIKQTANAIKPANSEIINGIWKCNSKYRLNKRKDGCEKVPFAAFSPRYSNEWNCISGYTKTGDICSKKNAKLKIPSNATISVLGDKWLCDYNYRINIAKDRCEKVPPNAYSTAGSNGWNCITGYSRNGRICTKRPNTPDPPDPLGGYIQLIIALIVILIFINYVFKKTSPPTSPKPKDKTPEKPKEPKTEKP